MKPTRWTQGRCRLVTCALFCGLCTTASASPGLSLVAIGNSITRHGPARGMGWLGDWGMAASSSQSDYVGRLAQLLRDGQREATVVQRHTHVALERSPKEASATPEVLAAAQSSDLLVMELGDNVSPSAVADFGRAYGQLLAQARPRTGRLICVSTWWQSAAVDALIKAACLRARGTFVDIGDIHRRAGMTASGATHWSDPGVQGHPGDAGMAEIAARVFAAWRESSHGTDKP